jgi:hypothetical protein
VSPALLAVAGVVVLALVVGAVFGLPKIFASHTPPPAGKPGLTAASARQIAGQINITQGDLPNGWYVDTSSTGPLSSFFKNTTSVGSGSAKGGSGQTSGTAIGAQLKACVGPGVPAGITRPGFGANPLAHAGSSPFKSPDGSALSYAEFGTVTAVYRTTTFPRTMSAAITLPKFSSCFAAALGKAIQTEDKKTVQSGGSIGTPQVQALALPQLPGAHAGGAGVLIPISGNGVSLDVSVSFVYICSAHTVTALFAFALGTPLTAGLVNTQVSGVEHRAVTVGSGIGT